MFAIVDIETSGGHALGHGITEIGIVLHNGITVEGKYSTLINPKVPIQKYVQGLTGITNAMVANAPVFAASPGAWAASSFFQKPTPHIRRF